MYIIFSSRRWVDGDDDDDGEKESEMIPQPHSLSLARCSRCIVIVYECAKPSN